MGKSVKDKNGEIESRVFSGILLTLSSIALYYSFIPWKVAVLLWVIAMFLSLPNRMKLTGDSIVKWINSIRKGDK